VSVGDKVRADVGPSLAPRHRVWRRLRRRERGIGVLGGGVKTADGRYSAGAPLCAASPASDTSDLRVSRVA